MSDISFTSRIRAVTLTDFSKITQSIGSANHADYPWTISKSVSNPNVYTKGICDCTSCLLTNGKNAVMMHLVPDLPNNHCVQFIREYLRGVIDLADKNLQAVVLGSKNNKKSLDIFHKFLLLMEDIGVSPSVFKNGKAPTNIAYKTNNDEIYISSLKIDNMLRRGRSEKEALDSAFEKIVVAPYDEIG